MVAKAFQGKVFLQIAPRLRWRVGKTMVESFRPMNELEGVIVGEPPAITFDDAAEVDVQDWLDRGRIQEAPAKTKPAEPLSDTEAHKAGAKIAAEGGGSNGD